MSVILSVFLILLCVLIIFVPLIYTKNSNKNPPKVEKNSENAQEKTDAFMSQSSVTPKSKKLNKDKKEEEKLSVENEDGADKKDEVDDGNKEKKE